MRDFLLKLSITASLPLIMASEAFAADDAHGAESAGGLPQMDPTWFPSQIFWLAVTFTTLYVIFGKKILPALSNTIEGRRDHIQNDLDMAEQLKEEAEKVHEAYDEILGAARQKSSALFIKTDENIKKNAQNKIEKFRADSMKQAQDVEASIEKATVEAKKDMHDVAAEIASRAAEKIVGVSTDIKQAQDVIQSISKKAA